MSLQSCKRSEKKCEGCGTLLFVKVWYIVLKANVPGAAEAGHPTSKTIRASAECPLSLRVHRSSSLPEETPSRLAPRPSAGGLPQHPRQMRPPKRKEEERPTQSRRRTGDACDRTVEKVGH